ncbi:MAG: hypothetical protein P8X92_08415 [Dehalococcoidia bacterium]
MSEKRYDVIFSGKLVEGARLEQVKANVAKLFKVEVSKVERLFTGKPVMIKKGVNEETAKKYLIAMKKAGALCEGKVQGAPASTAKPQAEKAAPKAAAAQASGTAKSEAELAAGEGGETKYVIKQPPAGLGELGSASVDEPGAVLVEHQEVPPPQVDTSGLSMDEPGATLVEHEEVPEPQVDTSDLSMDEPGTTLVEPEEEEELNVDLSGLSMDEPGAVIVEHEETEEPEIDTSKLSLSSD